jgi:hypothetical protein
MTDNKDKASNKLDKERADSEGMNTAIGAEDAKGDAEQDLLAMPGFLQDVIDQFRAEGDLLTVEEAAAALFEDLEGLEEYEAAFKEQGAEGLRQHMQDFLEPEDWALVKEEESERAVRVDQTRGGTPG